MSLTVSVIDKTLRDKEICNAYIEGLSISTLVEKYNLKRQSIYAILKKNAVSTRQTNSVTLCTGERNSLIIVAFLAGEAMPAIAKSYGMTRQGVQQVLKKNGYASKDGGASVRAAARIKKLKVDKLEKKDAYCGEKWGCSLAQWQLLRSMHPDFNLTPIARFIQHRSNVMKKKIEWSLTLWEWWRVWNESGKYPERGRGKDNYCMARVNDAGVYAVNNVEIRKVIDNMRRPGK